MQIPFSSLQNHLQRELAPVYHLFGAEALMVEEALDSLRVAATAAGCAERLRLTVESKADWDRLLDESHAPSLFSRKRLIEVRLPSGKPGREGAAALEQYAAAPPPDDILVLISGPVDKRARNGKWFKGLDHAGVYVEFPEIKPQQLPHWLEKRLRSRGVVCEPGVVQLLSRYVEGNLLAAAQEVDQLKLLAGGETLTLEKARAALADQARYTAFNFVDACVAGSPARSTRILLALRGEKIEPVVVLWTLVREIRDLCLMAAEVEAGQPLDATLNRHKIWSSRAKPVGAALKRLPLTEWRALLRQAARADLMAKGRAPLERKDIWEELESIGLMMCGQRIP